MQLKFKSLELKGNAILHSSFWAILGYTLGKGLALLGGICVANIIGKNLYGEYGLLKSTLLGMSIFSTFGLGYTATRFVAQVSTDENRVKELLALISTLQRITLLFSTTIAFIVLLLAPNIAKLLEDTSLTPSLRLLSVVIVLNALSTTQAGILSGLSIFRKMAQLDTVAGGISFLVTIIFSWLWQFHGAILALGCSYLTTCILYAWVLRDRKKVLKQQKSLSDTVISKKEILIFSLPIALQELVYTLLSWLSTLLLLKLSNYGEVAIFSASSQWSNIILMVPAALKGVTLSLLSRKNSQQQEDRVFKTMIWINFLCTSFMVLVFLIFRKVIESLYPTGFEGMYFPLLVLSCMMVLVSVYNVYHSRLVSQGNTWLTFYFMCFRETSRIFFMYVGIIHFHWEGATALALAGLLAQILALTSMILYPTSWHKRSTESPKL